MKFSERHFKEVAKLCLIFVDSKYCLEKVKKSYNHALKAWEMDFWWGNFTLGYWENNCNCQLLESGAGEG